MLNVLKSNLLGKKFWERSYKPLHTFYNNLEIKFYFFRQDKKVIACPKKKLQKMQFLPDFVPKTFPANNIRGCVHADEKPRRRVRGQL